MLKKTSKLPNYIQLNRKIRPQDDFYGYVCHSWCKDNPLPDIHSRWGQFNKLAETVDKQVHKILTQWLKTRRLSTNQKQAVIFYQTLLDKEKYQSQSLQTLKKMLNQIKKCKDTPSDKAQLLALTSSWGLSTIISVEIGLNYKNPDRFQMSIDPSDLSLPNRDYYLNMNSKMRKFRRLYLEFIQKQTSALAKLGLNYQINPDKILQIETALARFNLPLAAANDIKKTYNPYSWQKMLKTFNFDWRVYFKQLQLPTNHELIITQPLYLKRSLKFLKQLPLVQLKQYLAYLLFLEYAGLLSEKISQIQFDFFSNSLQGAQKIKPLKKRVAEQTNVAFNDVLGQAYVKKYFQNSDKQEIEKLAKLVADSFHQRLAQNSWMSDSSQKYAQNKLKRIIVNVGYNNKAWRDYSHIKLTKDNPLENMLILGSDYLRQTILLLQKKPDRTSFGSLDQRVHRVTAWTHLFLLNTNYPAAILQPPFYDHQASLEYNLGALGSIIGHELTHNFDLTGSQIDDQGRYANWLSLKEKRAFKRATAKLIKTANQHYPVPKIKMKGHQVASELIADLGGLEIVLDIVKARYPDKQAQQKALKEVFIAYAYFHAENESTESKIMLTKAGVHPHTPFRVNGVLAHCNDFYTIFKVKKGDNLYLRPTERALIW